MVDPADLAGRLGGAARAQLEYGLAAVDLPAGEWLAAARRLRDEFGFAFFDWLTGYETDDGIAVAAHLWSRRLRGGLLVRTVAEGEPPAVPSVTPVWPGADWHERETAEMFGVVFPGHPNPLPLLLPDGFEGHPLRKDFYLPARQRPWPGAADPDPAVARRRPPRPLGPVAP